MSFKPLANAVLLCLLLCQSVSAQMPFQLTGVGSFSAQQYGSALAHAGDLDGDGISDLLVGSPGFRAFGVSAAQGAVEAVSGRDGSVIWRRIAPLAGEAMGVSVVGNFDVNDDGVPDLLTGAPFADPITQNEGKVYLLDGLSGRTLHVFNGFNQGALLGSDLALIGDCDGDGKDDFLFGAYFGSLAFGAEGYVDVVSSKSFTLIRRHWGANVFDNFGESLTRVGDVDGDTIDDYAISITGWDGQGVNRGAVDVYSSISGVRLYRFVGRKDLEGFGKSISSYSTPENPHKNRLIIGSPLSPQVGSFGGKCDIVSLQDGSFRNELLPDGALRRFGETVQGVGDVNGDGVDDFLVAATADATGGTLAGAVHVFDGATVQPIGFYAGVTGSSLGRTLCAFADLNGDGFDEFGIGSAFPGNSFLEGSMAITSLIGAAKRNDPSATLGLDWTQGLGDAAAGALTASGLPGASLSMVFSFKNESALGPIFIDPAAVIFRDGFVMPASGTREYRLNLRVPSIAGTVITAQLLELPSLANYSPAVELLFGP